jgi:O-acetyl-ADP-ribose deacetylase (regulator of RNase III)
VRSSIDARREVIQCNIVTLAVDAIVNAANASLLGGGGVGRSDSSCRRPGVARTVPQPARLPSAAARLTRGYRLPARYVIHTAAPIWRAGDRGKPQTLHPATAIRSRSRSRSICARLRFRQSDAGCTAILRGRLRASRWQTAAVLAREASLEKIWLVCFDETVHQAYLAALRDVA